MLPDGAAERLDGSNRGEPRSQRVEMREQDFHDGEGHTVEDGVLESGEDVLQVVG